MYVSQIMRNATIGSGRVGAPIEEFLTRLRTLLDALNEEGVEATTALRERISASIDALEPKVDQLRDVLSNTADTVHEVVEEHPWSAVATGALAGIAVGCVAAAVAANYMPGSDFADRADRYRRRVVREARPYARRARKLANHYWPF